MDNVTQNACDNVSVSLTMHIYISTNSTYQSGDMGTDKILERKPHVTHLLKNPTTTQQHTTTHNMTTLVKWVLLQSFVR